MKDKNCKFAKIKLFAINLDFAFKARNLQAVS